MATQADEAKLGMWGKLIGLASIVLWFGVAIPARLIGLVGYLEDRTRGQPKEGW